MKTINILIFLFHFLGGFAQNVLVLDKNTNNPIPFAEVQFKDKGFYITDKGDFNIKRIPNKIDTINIRHLNYQNQKLAVSEIKKKKVIYLKPKINRLKEVIINGKYKTEILDPLSSFFISHSSWPLTKKNEICACLKPSKKLENSIINKVIISLKRMKTDYFKSNYKAVVRLNIYKKINNSIYSTATKKINNQNLDLKFNISQNKILFDEKGLSFCLELLGYFSNGNLLKRKAIVRPKLHKKTSDAYTSHSFLKFKFNDSQKIFSITNLINKNRMRKKAYKRRDLSIGLHLKTIE